MCLNPKARYCECPDCSEEIANLNTLRNRAQYEKSGNKLISWTFSDEWWKIPASTKVRGECVVSLLRSGARVTKFVVQGAVSGEITC